ncbi:MAG TPA: hypothetical protein VEU08_18825 [Vicinamibacterales bacterium]|nr:hypothetical protein [Vicinamibacterales bacterium]
MSQTKFVPGPGWRPTEVHPAAEAFPMLPDDELAALADDIKTNGLRLSIVTDAAGVLIDGRNRLRACEIAGVEPTFSQLNGQDARAFIVSANLTRRNLSKGQQAMALAFIYPQPERGGRGRKAENSKETLGFSTMRLSQARSILHHSLTLAEDVKAGRKHFDEALKIVQQEREVSANSEAVMAELRRNAPDLADLVVEERLTLGEAHSAFKKREADAIAAEANKREVMLRLSEGVWRSCTAWASEEFLAGICARLDDDTFRRAWLDRLRLEPERLPDVERGAKAFARLISRIMKEAGDV